MNLPTFNDYVSVINNGVSLVKAGRPLGVDKDRYRYLFTSDQVRELKTLSRKSMYPRCMYVGNELTAKVIEYWVADPDKTYVQLGEIFGITPNMVHHRLKHYFYYMGNNPETITLKSKI